MLIYTQDDKKPVKNQIGGKAFSLAQMQKLNINIPKWFVLTSDCLLDFLYESRDEYFHLLNNYTEMNRRKIIKIIEATNFSEAAKQQIRSEMARTFSPMELVSVRSSAVDEDGEKHSFAGMMESYLYIKQDDGIFDYIKKCYASCFSERAMQYRYENGLINSKIRIAVIIQAMVDPDYAGVMFTSNPQTNDPDETLISVVTGVGENLVSGKENSSDYTVNTLREIKHENPQRKARLSEDLLLKLYDVGQIIEKSHRPRIAQDIEFAVKDNEVYILQSRPITNYAHIDKNKPRTILDNSNIIESYSGVTTPLTFTFAREVYAKIYKQTMRNFYIDEAAIKSIQKDLDNMLCFYENKIYYRLNSWYRMTSLYPGYEKNKKYMETMMGVKTPLQETGGQAKTRLVKIYIRFAHKFIHMKGASKKFVNKFNRITRPYNNNNFSNYTSEQLLEVYKDLENEILDDFITPIANDMGAMVTYGALNNLAKEAKIHNAEGLISDILSKQGDVESAKQSEELLMLVKEIRREPNLYKFFKESSTEDLLKQLKSNSLIIFSKLNSYINKYGARSMDELKLETVTMQQDPSFLINIIKQYLELPQMPEVKEKKNKNSEAKFLSYFNGIKKAEAKFLIKETKFFVRNREMLRLRRTYIYAIVRNIYLRIGENMANERLIRSPRDIFYLEKNEITDIIKRGKYTVDEIRDRIDLRKKEYKINDTKETYERMYFYGDVKPENMVPIYSRQETKTKTNSRLLYGVAGGGDVVTGVVKYVDSPENANVRGYILMAKRTDPGWTVLFPMADAIIIERGSILSHSAVVARELGITLVAGVRGLTQKVQDGDTVKVDGKNGTIEIIRRRDDKAD